MTHLLMEVTKKFVLLEPNIEYDRNSMYNGCIKVLILHFTLAFVPPKGFDRTVFFALLK